MLDTFFLINFDSSTKMEAWDSFSSQHYFGLATCQRKLILGLMEIDNNQNIQLQRHPLALTGTRAYVYALEVITGLKGVIKAESEIMSQFRLELNRYVQRSTKSNKLLRILEKLSKDAKHIRTHFLKNIPIKSHAYCARSILKDHLESNTNAPVLILGSGALATDLIYQLKKSYPIIICARNKEKVDKLCAIDELNIKAFSKEHYQNFAAVINTIDDISYALTQTEGLNAPIIINYSTNPIHLPCENKRIINLLEILTLLEKANNISSEKIQGALKAICQLADIRASYFIKTNQEENSSYTKTIEHCYSSHL